MSSRKISKLFGYFIYKSRRTRMIRARNRHRRARRKLRSASIFRSDYRVVYKRLRYLKILIARLFLRVFYIMPINKKRILISSFQFGKFSCNPKYIAEYIKEEYGDEYQILWVFWRARDFNWLEDWGYQTVKLFSFKYFYYAVTSGVFIYNMKIPAVIPYRKKQLVINTAHGSGAYKKLLLDNPTLNPLDAKEINLSDKNTKVYLSGCAAYSDAVIRGAFSSQQTIWDTGMPRNDILVNAKTNRDKVKKLVLRFKRCYSIPENHKILLYAPTYRKGDRVAHDFFINWDIIISEIKNKFGGEWTIVYRIHYFVKDKIMTKNNQNYQIVDASGYSDMQELLLASDILITDYSSSVWDYAHLYRPGFLYAPDIDIYSEKQGFYTGIDKWPFEFAKNNDELVELIRSYDHKKASKKIKTHHSSLGSFDDGQATKRVVDLVRSWLNNDNKANGQ